MTKKEELVAKSLLICTCGNPAEAPHSILAGGGIHRIVQ